MTQYQWVVSRGPKFVVVWAETAEKAKAAGITEMKVSKRERGMVRVAAAVSEGKPVSREI